MARALGRSRHTGQPGVLWDRVWHPVVLMGKAIGWLDRRFNAGGQRRLRGALCLASMLVGTLVLCMVIVSLPFGWILEVAVAAILLAQRSLVDHVEAVATALGRSLTEGRSAVAQIVGRDPETLDESGVARAAIESAAENFSDGVVAPAFWFLLAGLPGIALYKAINTADSMIGHRTERHLEFGWASARLDDLVNWVPARLTAMLFLTIGGAPGRWRSVATEAPLHKSVNAGWPEAALAYVMGVALAGPRSYAGGVVAEDPFVNEAGRHALGPADILRAVTLLWRAWGVLLLLAVLATLVPWL